MERYIKRDWLSVYLTPTRQGKTRSKQENVVVLHLRPPPPPSPIRSSSGTSPSNHPNPANAVQPRPSCGPNPCHGISYQKPGYICGDPRLGPLNQPHIFPLSTETATYQALGNLCPKAYLEKWATSVSSSGTYQYPPNNGFALDSSGNPISGQLTLVPGQKLDRFGGETGSFLAPLGAPYIERSLPPSSLGTSDWRFPFNYRVYEVVEEFVVTAGPVRAWFEQPGMGTRFMAASNVADLVEGGFLRRLAWFEYDEAREFADDYTPRP